MVETWADSRKIEPKDSKVLDKSKNSERTKTSEAPCTDLYHSLFPIYHLCKFTGMLPVQFVKDESKKYIGIVKNYQIVYGVILTILFLCAQSWGMWRDLKNGWQNSTRLSSETSITVTCCDVCTVYILLLTIIIGSPLRWKYLQNAMDKLVKVDEHLRIITPKKLRRKTIILAVCALSFLTILSCIDYVSWKYANAVKRPNASSTSGPINYSPIYFMYFIITIFEIQYCITTYNVGIRFGRLNTVIEKQSRSKEVINYFIKNLGLGNHSKSNEQIISFIQSDLGYGRHSKQDNSIWPISETHENQQNVAVEISKLITLHGLLCDCVLLINNSFGIAVLIAIVSCLIHLIITPYFLYMELVSDICLWQTIVIQTLWCMFHVVLLLLLVQPCYLSNYESQRTGVIISQLLSSNWGPNVRKQLEIFSLQIIHRPVDFSAYGLFSMDRSLLASISGAITTYLVILIQFQTSDDDKGQKQHLQNVTDFLLKNVSKIHN